MDRARFRILAENFKKALDNLNSFEKENLYLRKSHSDRDVKNFNKNDNSTDNFPYIRNINIAEISSYNYPEFPKNWNGDKGFIEKLKSQIQSEKND